MVGGRYVGGRITVQGKQYMNKSQPLKIEGVLRRNELEPDSITIGVHYSAAFWPKYKTIVMLPEFPNGVVALTYLERIVEEVKKQVLKRKWQTRFDPRKWKIYVCHLGTVSIVDLKTMEFRIVT
jgi:hypothetical protein